MRSTCSKIDAATNGAGSVQHEASHQGDFALTQGGVPTTDPSEWFSFQHFPSLISQSGSQTMIAVWDNGDNRPLDSSGTICQPAGVACYSRATVFQVDESAKVADLQWDTLPGDFGIWGGSINQLENGNVEFDLNAISGSTTLLRAAQEVTQTSTRKSFWQLQFAL